MGGAREGERAIEGRRGGRERENVREKGSEEPELS